MTGDALEEAGPDPGEFDLEMAVSVLSGNSTDVSILVKLLVDQLGSALGKRLVVERSRGLLRRSETIEAVQILLGDNILRAEIDGGSVRCTIGHSSGGIRIRSDRVAIDVWLRHLLGALKAEAAQSEATRQALENIMIGGTS